MTKNEFLQQLHNHLMPLSPSEREDIIGDFEEHFQAGLEQGKSEEQICAELGNPYTCALQYLRQPQTPPTEPAQSAPQAAPNAQNAQPTRPAAQRPANYDPYAQRNRMLWGITFICFVLIALGVYPASLMLAVGLPIVFVGVGTVLLSLAALPTALTVCFLVSLCVMTASAGVFLFLLMTWLLKFSFRRAGF